MGRGDDRTSPDVKLIRTRGPVDNTSERSRIFDPELGGDLCNGVESLDSGVILRGPGPGRKHSKLKIALREREGGQRTMPRPVSDG